MIAFSYHGHPGVSPFHPFFFFFLQGGDPQGDGRGGTRIHIPAEFYLSHHTGAVNMARV